MLKDGYSRRCNRPEKKPRSEAQVQSLETARAKARELRASRNVIREKHGISDETDETPTENTETETETESNSESASETDEEQPPAVVEKKPKEQKEKLIKPVKKHPASKPRSATPYQPQQKDDHVPVPQNFRMMSRNQYILFQE